MNPPTRVRCFGLLLASALCLFHSPSIAASMCNADKAASEALAKATAMASAKFLEAASEVFLAFKEMEGTSNTVETHSARAGTLLDEAISGYRAALSLSEDLARADGFLRDRPFEKLQRVLGITPGTLNHTRWELLAKTARESKTPAADLIRVCLAGAESLKSVTARVKAGSHPTQLRRAAYAWHLVLMHGSLVSDALDSSVR